MRQIAQCRVIRCKGRVGAHCKRGLALFGEYVHEPNPAQPKQLAEFGETHAHRAAAHNQHLVPCLEAKIAKRGVDLAPRAEQHGGFGRNVRIHLAHDFVDFGPAVVGVGHAIRHHRGMVARDQIIGEAAPTAEIRAVSRRQQQCADDTVAQLEGAHLVANRLHDARGLVAKGQRVVLHAREVPFHQFAVGGVAQAGHLGAHQRIIGTRGGFGELDELDAAGFSYDYGSHSSTSS